MSPSLETLLAQVREHRGIAHKRDIQQVADALAGSWPHPFANGDDSAVIAEGEGYLLLAMEGFINDFVAIDPWFAGWCGVMVNVSDIAAMGGRPLAVVNALWSADQPHAREVLAGMRAASQAYQVPVVGGHTNLHSNQPQLAVAIAGRAGRLLDSFAVQAGQELLVAINLAGNWHPPGLNWDAATQADPAGLRAAIELLPALAESGVLVAAKDISQAGLLGTLVMLLESAQCGATLDLVAIPKPDHCDWRDWLCAFPSFGFLLVCESAQREVVIKRFADCGISAAKVGIFHPEKKLMVERQHESACFWDLHHEPLTGMRR
ncbi:sll0787 family AIR synthase-like protein [Erwinia endophytica]|uniref:sll0787 family AIR synthase-like protein n=1 Tax=Erwinia endophytica TaxID=1563158 RepID=UPI001265F5A5|nr:sll0787 family AIR synthase-like protein [Erwinia endophytica]KAB8312767.1 sll0787 family AIR synthase-like protein [Erwinia endophytica]